MRCVHGYTRSVPRCLLTELHSRPFFTVQAWHLRAELRGHGEDVRAVAQAGKLGVATTSRDKTLRLWTVDEASSGGVTEATVFVGHTHFVGPLVWVPPGVLPVGAEEGALVTGSRDTTVIVWHPHAAVPLQRLAGHTQQVRAVRVSTDACRVVVAATGSPASTPTVRLGIDSDHTPLCIQVSALCVTSSGDIVSGDHGGELRVWRDGACAQVRDFAPARGWVEGSGRLLATRL
jgi:phospholipase A-2-activating protein